MADPNLQIGDGGRSSRPCDKGGTRSKFFFLALKASVLSKNKGEAGLPGPLPGIRHCL